MNWFQLGGRRPGSGFTRSSPWATRRPAVTSLGFWRPQHEDKPVTDPKFQDLQPGHWTWNNYNWIAVGSFIRHMAVELPCG